MFVLAMTSCEKLLLKLCHPTSKASILWCRKKISRTYSEMVEQSINSFGVKSCDFIFAILFFPRPLPVELFVNCW